MRCTRRASLVAFALALPQLAGGQTVTVTTTADAVDVNATTATVADLPGPDGLVSLSEALIASNHTPGRQTIGFAIPPSDPGFGFLMPGRAVFTALTGFYWRAEDEVTIDGTTQTVFAGDTHPGGNEVVLYGKTLYLNAPNCALIGFDSTSVQASASGCLVEGNSGSMNIALFGGSGSTVRGNTGGTIRVDRSDGNVVVGNTVQRVRVNGFGSSQPALDNRIGGPAPADRNFLTGYGTWNSEGLPSGAAVELTWTAGTVVQGNWIGTTPDGLAQGSQACTMGIALRNENHDVEIRGNRIAGILGHGTGPHHAGQLFGWAIYFWGTAHDVRIEGNTIGLDVTGAPVLGSVWGVSVDNYAGYTVSDTTLADNAIAGHLFDGVRVAPTATLRLARNSIHSNGGLAVDLIPGDFAFGVSPNDPLDADGGGNGVQNYPVLTLAHGEPGGLRVVGTLDSSALGTFTLEFFASPACDPSGFGEAWAALGQASVSTDATGSASFDVVIPASPPAGWSVTATATLEPLGATSELSACTPVVDGTTRWSRTARVAPMGDAGG